MGIRYLHVSVASTALSFVGLQVWTELSLDRLRADAKNISLGDSEHALDLLLGSYFTIALLANFVLNVYILLLLSLKVRVAFIPRLFQYKAMGFRKLYVHFFYSLTFKLSYSFQTEHFFCFCVTST